MKRSIKARTRKYYINTINARGIPDLWAETITSFSIEGAITQYVEINNLFYINKVNILQNHGNDKWLVNNYYYLNARELPDEEIN